MVRWEIDIVGEGLDIAEIARSAGAWQVEIIAGPDGRTYLTGGRFAPLDSSADVRAEAHQVLQHLNGRARLERADHRPVRLGSVVSRVRPDGRRDINFQVEAGHYRLRVHPPEIRITRSDGSIVSAPRNAKLSRDKLIADDPTLTKILDALGGEISWQRLRVVFEMLTALIGSGRKDSQAIWKKGYGTRLDVETFKANAEDPRHSGLEAVHGVPDGRLKGKPMTIEEGLAFVTRLFNAFLDRSTD